MNGPKKFYIYKSCGNWILHCMRCESREETSSFDHAIQLMPSHVQWWHSFPIVIPNARQLEEQMELARRRKVYP